MDESSVIENSQEASSNADGRRTGGIGQLILSALDLVLQPLSFAPSRSDLGLHLFAAHIGHFIGTLPQIGEKKKEGKWEVEM